ncbi:MAG TPA: LacI family DNA-binding transcriptional regulator [Chloroflexota bacterium]|nr:LacI family DNA-binding transcriptional regulator [Chloroflexota bacterium]
MATIQEAPASPRAATIHDVARAAGVAIGTASKALNGRGKLRTETRARVRAAAADLGFRPNDLAQSLLRGRTFTAGLLATDQYGRFSLPLVWGIEDALVDAQFSVFLCNVRDDAERERRHLDSLLAKRVDGIVVVGGRIDPRPPIDLDGGAAVPVLYVFAQSTDPTALCLIPDDGHGGRLAAEHLVGLGRRRVAHVTGPESWEAVRRRRDGMLEALAEHGLGCPPRRVRPGRWDAAWGYDAASQLLDEDRAIDAIFCGNDRIAHGVVDALRARGIGVPDDVAVVGFDNHEVVATMVRPPLTSVDMQLEDLGKLAGRCLLELIEGRALAGSIRQPCRLVVRESSGATERQQ